MNDIAMAGMTPCRGCNKDIHETAPTCPHCGATQRTGRHKSKVVAGILAILLGGLGVHRFYLGQWWGIFYLLFFWLWIPGLIALVEGIVFLVSNQESWDKKYNEGKGAGDDGASAAVIVVVVVMVGFVGVAVIGILAAIALPAYQDYTIRAKTNDAMLASSSARQAVAEYVVANRSLPNSDADLGQTFNANNEHVESINVTQGGVVVIRLSDYSPTVQGKTIEYQPTVEAGELIWDCKGGTLEARYRMAQCR